MGAQLVWASLGAFIAFCFVVIAAIYYMDIVRAGCDTRFGKFFLEARGRTKQPAVSSRKKLK